jgi:hypothetical protein
VLRSKANISSMGASLPAVEDQALASQALYAGNQRKSRTLRSDGAARVGERFPSDRGDMVSGGLRKGLSDLRSKSPRAAQEPPKSCRFGPANTIGFVRTAA